MHRFMISLISKLNQTIFFRFLSSVRLAVPVMIGLIVSIAIGTVLESRYSAEYAKLYVYDALWFYAILCLLATNIFCSMMSRYPWRFTQIGFVVTHTGMLILLFGSWVTKNYGIDGSIQIQEGETQNTMVLPKLMIGYQFDGSPTLSSVVFNKSLSELKSNDLEFINNQIGHVVRAHHYIPFAEVEKGYVADGNSTGPIGVSFGLKSAFFDVKEWLHSEENPIYKMGPATLKLIIDDPNKKSKIAISKTLKPQRVIKTHPGLLVLDVKTNKTIQLISLKDLKSKPITVNGIKISADKIFERAVVSDNKIVENDDPSSALNPAIELKVEKGNEKKREVLYAKYEGFTLNQEGLFGLKFIFQSTEGQTDSSSSSLPEGHPKIGENDSNLPLESGLKATEQNVIEFHVNRSQKDEVRIVLLKGGEKIAEQIMKEGSIFQTPWMGIKLFIASISFGAQSKVDVRAVDPTPGKNLPQSAIKLQPIGSNQPFWLVQGEVKNISIGGRNAFLVFSNETKALPFGLRLNQFTKKDYPGTETPYSYESHVTNLRDQTNSVISMNEPLKVDGYTLYQASFSLQPGQKPISILSVNMDPGRWIKYLGSIILSLGVIIFTMMKSRFYKKI